MKILTKKKQCAIVKSAIANALIAQHAIRLSEMTEIEKEQTFARLVDNTTEIVATVGGLWGLAVLEKHLGISSMAGE